MRLFPALLLALATAPTFSPARDAASVYARAKSAVVTIRTDKASGTGFAIGDGTLVLTCYHVVKDAAWVRTDETGGRSVALVGVDPTSDVALLRLSVPRKHRLELRSGPTPQPGMKVYAIGTSLGYLDHTISEGIVSGKRLVGDVAYLQITAAVSHGNSGSPVLDDQGRVVGMADFVLDGGQSLNFAVSSHNLGVAKASIQAKERVARAASSSRVRKTSRKQVVLGRLAVASRDADIYAKPGQGADVVFSAKRGTYLVARSKAAEGWVPIVMKDRRLGYAREGDVTILGRVLTEDAGKPIVLTPRPGVSKDDSEARMAGQLISSLALMHEGTGYVEGGTSLDDGVGNGEFVMLVYAQEGYAIPASPAEQAKVGEPVERFENLIEDDRLYFWDKATGRIGRAAVYIGNGNVLMADPSLGKVATVPLSESLRKIAVAARRSGPKKPVTADKGADAPK